MFVISWITRVHVVFIFDFIYYILYIYDFHHKTTNDKLGKVSNIRTPYVMCENGAWKKIVEKLILFKRKSVR